MLRTSGGGRGRQGGQALEQRRDGHGAGSSASAWSSQRTLSEAEVAAHLPYEGFKGKQEQTGSSSLSVCE